MELKPIVELLDCEQSLFFFRFSESNARARERRSRETRETRAAAPPVTRVAIFVSRVLLDGLQKKERLLVVYGIALILDILLMNSCDT